MGIQERFEANLDSLVAALFEKNEHTYSPVVATQIIDRVPKIQEDPFACLVDPSKLFDNKPVVASIKTSHWIAQHKSFHPEDYRAGFVQIFPNTDLNKAYETYGFGYQSLDSETLFFSPLFRTAVGSKLFPMLPDFFSRTRHSYAAKLPKIPSLELPLKRASLGLS